VPDFTETKEILTRYLRARVPVVVIRSMEPVRVMELLTQSAAEMGAMAYTVYSRTEGLRDLMSNQVVSDDTSLSAALEMSRQTFKTRSNVNVVFTEIDDLEQESPTSRHFAELARLAEQRQGTLIFLTDRPVWSGLSRLGMSVSLDLPTIDELTEVLEGFIEANRPTTDIEWGFDEVRQAAEILRGITETEAINVIATMLARRRLLNSEIPELSQFKDRIFGDLSGLERIPLKEDYAIGGLRTLRDWLDKRERAMKVDLSQTSFHPPKGVLLVGVPGCGKSLSAKAVAQAWQLPLYRLDMASVLGMYVGQSESQLREALETADRVAPCVLWIDEIEKGLANGTGDSGVSRRLLGQFLFWLQESTSKVFLVATANDVTSLPPELLRKGRFDEMFFVDLPDRQDREEIIRMYFRKHLSHDIPPDLTEQVVTRTEGFSGSDLAAVIHELGLLRHTEHRSEVPNDGEVLRAFSDVVPFSATNPEELAAIRQWAQGRCRPAGQISDGNGPVAQPGAVRRVFLQ
jgi:hypothetical protein